MKVISLVNHKGGVGKTTTTLNLGKALSLKEKKVLIIDIDPQSNLSQSVGIAKPEKSLYDTMNGNEKLPIYRMTENFHLVPATLELAKTELELRSKQLAGFTRLKKSLGGYEEYYDYILIDCPPSLGILTVNAMVASTHVMIICAPEYLSTTGLQTIIDLFEETKEAMNEGLELAGILFTQYARTVANKVVIESLESNYQHKVYRTVIRRNTKISEASIAKKTIFDYEPKSIGAEDYGTLAEEILMYGKK